ncbi:hypothetical protein PENSPDRAFT_575214 [Peniophora sp. CONT]|nr:hypothetical protein PENSPDRAFT_575214 [Peniophora sp. CONT]
MAVPPQVLQWITQTYPKPKIDPDWLVECYDWIVGTHGLDPARDLHQILQMIDGQLLESSLNDSTVHYTGLPRNIGQAKKGTIGVPPVLVQITSITEIGHSAFTLQSTRQTRVDRADLAGLAEEDGGEDDGPIPRYPRSMLQFRISDGSTEIDAIEYRKIPELELGETPLGYKVCPEDKYMEHDLTLLIYSAAPLERRESPTRYCLPGTQQCHPEGTSRGRARWRSRDNLLA